MTRADRVFRWVIRVSAAAASLGVAGAVTRLTPILLIPAWLAGSIIGWAAWDIGVRVAKNRPKARKLPAKPVYDWRKVRELETEFYGRPLTPIPGHESETEDELSRQITQAKLVSQARTAPRREAPQPPREETSHSETPCDLCDPGDGDPGDPGDGDHPAARRAPGDGHPGAHACRACGDTHDVLAGGYCTTCWRRYLTSRIDAGQRAPVALCLDICRVGGYLCSLPAGHPGMHDARDYTDRTVARWAGREEGIL